jgi:phage/plasmid primase-like uncharacterized protein
MDAGSPAAVAQSRADGVSHRVNVALRFAQRVSQRDAAFIVGAANGLPLPVTLSGGDRRPITGFNRWMLMQVMQDQQWADPRFFTATQARTAGWQVDPQARPVVLQFVNAIDADGVVLEVPEVKRFEVFHATAVDGCGPAKAAVRLSVAALQTAMMAADFEPGQAVAPTLMQWVDTLQRELGVTGGGPHEALSRSMAATVVAAELDLTDADRKRLVQLNMMAGDWERIEQMMRSDPASFFEAVREAELVSGQVLTQVRIAEQELRAERDIVRAKAETVREFAGSLPQHAQEGQGNMTKPQRPRSFEAYAARVEAMFAERAAVLAVPKAEKDRAKLLGAVWYGRQEVWFVPKGGDVAKFKEWDPREASLGPVASDNEIIDAFQREMESMGLELPNDFKADGEWHNVRVTANKGYNRSGAYLLDIGGGQDGSAIGSINNKFSGESRAWRFDGPLLTQEQKARMRQESMRRAEASDREIKKIQETAAEHAAEIMAVATSADDHPYVVRKGIEAECARQVPGQVLLKYSEFIGESGRSAIRADQRYLVIPMRDAAGQLRAVQAISEDGSVKSFMRGAQKKGTMVTLGADSLNALFASAPSQDGAALDIAFVEGFATGASLRRAGGMPVVVCWDAGNLEHVAGDASRAAPRSVRAVLAPDNDQFHVEKALGYLAHNMGVNPNSERGSHVEVLRDPRSSRLVSLGDAVADGQWHAAPHGRYCMQLEREPDSTEIRRVVIEAIANDGAKLRASFNNRGVEAGRVALSAFEGREQRDGQTLTSAVLMIPEFRCVDRRATDWNDLAHFEGPSAVTRQVLMSLGRTQEPHAKNVARDAGRQPASTGPQR